MSNIDRCQFAGKVYMEIIFVLISILGLLMTIIGIGYIKSALREVKKITRLINKECSNYPM